jgi:hypothetical protein
MKNIFYFFLGAVFMLTISVTTKQEYEILPCPICEADGYLHQAVNDIENPMYAVDCTKYDKGKGHKRVGKYWLHCKEDAVLIWNKNR